LGEKRKRTGGRSEEGGDRGRREGRKANVGQMQKMKEKWGGDGVEE